MHLAQSCWELPTVVCPEDLNKMSSFPAGQQLPDWLRNKWVARSLLILSALEDGGANTHRVVNRYRLADQTNLENTPDLFTA